MLRAQVDEGDRRMERGEAERPLKILNFRYFKGRRIADICKTAEMQELQIVESSKFAKIRAVQKLQR